MTPGRRTTSSLCLAAILALVAPSLVGAQGIDTPRVPLRTALMEINTLRAEFTDNYNKKATELLTAMYMPDAVSIRPDGSTLLGRAAIGKAMAEEAPSWGQATISSDTVRVFGNTAWDIGTMSTQGSDGQGRTTRYLVVLRRGVTRWRISSVAVVPQTQVTAAK